MRIIDLSQPIFDGCPNCPEHPPVKSEILVDHDAVGWRLEQLTIASHTGSHVDSPLHKLKGAPCLDAIPLEKWVGPAYIRDLRPCRPDQRCGSDNLTPLLATAMGGLRDKIALLLTGWGDIREKTDLWLNHAPM